MERRLNFLHKHQDTFSLTTTINNKTLLASYKVYCFAKTSNLYTIAKNLILPLAIEKVYINFDEKEAAELKLPLSNNTIERQINDMAEGIETQAEENFNKCTYFSL